MHQNYKGGPPNIYLSIYPRANQNITKLHPQTRLQDCCTLRGNESLQLFLVCKKVDTPKDTIHKCGQDTQIR